MRSVEVKFISSNKEHPENEQFSVAIERTRDGNWDLLGRNAYVRPGDVAKTYILEVGERLIIEPSGVSVEMVYDKEQNAAMPREAFESRPDEGTKAQIEADRQKEVREIERGGDRINTEADRAAMRARDAVLDEQQKRDLAKKEATRNEENSQAAKASTQVGPQTTVKPPATSTPSKPNVTVQPAPAPAAVAGRPATPGGAGPANVGAIRGENAPKVGAGGMTAPGPSTGGQSSADVK